jgi:hypothetical protein
MSIRFNDTAYKLAAMPNQTLEVANQKYGQFKYGLVTWETFKNEYSPEGWQGRKMIALPAAAWTGTVQVVYHLAKAILVGIPKALFDRGRYLKAQVFCIARDFQESYGRLTSLFNDRYGQFHIEESQFQKTYYDAFAHNVNLETSSSFAEKTSTKGPKYNGTNGRWFNGDNGNDVWFTDNAKKTSLFEYKTNIAAEDADFLRSTYNPTEIYLKLSDSHINLAEFMERADEDTLKTLTLGDLMDPIKESKMKFALLSDADFNILTVADLQKKVNLNQVAFIKQRLNKFSNSGQSNQSLVVTSGDDIVKLPLKDLTRLTATDIKTHQATIPTEAFLFFTNDQVQTLELATLQSSQNTALFAILTTNEVKERLARFQDQDVTDAIHLKLLTGRILKFLTDAQVDKLELSQLTKHQTDTIFSSKQNSTQDAQRFKHFKAKDVQNALEKGTLTTAYQLGLISNQQLEDIQLFQLSKPVIDAMFSGNYGDQHRFACFKSDDVQEALIRGLISDTYRLRLLSDVQLESVRLSKLPKTVIGAMFPPQLDNLKEDLRRFAYFKSEDIQFALESNNLSKHHIELIPLDVIKKLDFNRLPQETINLFFPHHSVNYLKRSSPYWCVDEDLRRTSEKQRQKNDTLLQLLPEQQQQVLKLRLYQPTENEPLFFDVVA